MTEVGTIATTDAEEALLLTIRSAQEALDMLKAGRITLVRNASQSCRNAAIQAAEAVAVVNALHYAAAR